MYTTERAGLKDKVD